MMYMNEETKRKLNSTQTIADNMDNIIEALKRIERFVNNLKQKNS